MKWRNYGCHIALSDKENDQKQKNIKLLYECDVAIGDEL